jgi:hypothetical protein
MNPIKRALQKVLLASLLLAATSPLQAALTDALISYWPLDAVADGKTPDVIADNDLTLVGPIGDTLREGKPAFQFDGTSTYFTNLHPTDASITGLPIYRDGGYTIAMWVKGPPQTARYLFAEGSTASNNPLLILQTGQAAANNDKLDIIIRNLAGGAAGTPVNHRVTTSVVFDDTWHHIAWVDTDGAVQVYVDGILDATDFSYSPVGSIPFNTAALGTLVRAAISTGNIFNGAIDDVAVWGRALTEAEVNELRINGIPTSSTDVPPSLVTDLQDASRRVGDWHVFSVELNGTRPFGFQWSRDGSPILNATNQTLRISNLTTDNNGETYSLTVTNAVGSVTTRTATLNVASDPAANVSSGLINYWPLDDITQEDTLLLSPDLYSGNDMVLVNFVDTNDTVPGQFGNALQFDFVTKYTFRTNGSAIYNNLDHSISFWVKAPVDELNPQNDRRVFSEGSTGNNNPLFTLGTVGSGASQSLSVFIRGDAGGGGAVAGRASTSPVFDDTWHHVVWTDSNGQGKLYIDGVLDDTDYTYTRPTLTLNTTSLGAVVRAAVGNYFFGALDEVATWNRVLSWTEIQQIRTSGIPEPVGAVPPDITMEPVPPFGPLFVGDTVSFVSQFSGTLPLGIQWYKDNQPIASTQNGTSTNETLILTNLQLSAVGDYFVVVTNVAGSATSSVVRIENIVNHVPKTSGVVLNIDVGLTTAPNPQPGFDEFNLGLNGTNYGGVGVTFSSIGGAALADRNRVTGAMVVNNPPTLTQAQLYNDFIFANNTTDGTGLRIRIHRLAPNTPHEVTIWSYDPQSNPERIADWTETSSGTPVEIRTGYAFTGSVLPTADNEQTMTAVVTSSATGELILEGVKNGGGGVSAFVNAIRLVANPDAPEITVSNTQLQNGNLRITVQAPGEGENVSLQQATNLGTPDWTAAQNVTTVQTGADSAIFEIPASEPMRFYRVVSNP